MDSVDWNAISIDTPEYAEISHKGRDCARIAIRGYSSLPWFVNCSHITPIIDIWSYGGNLVAVFDAPQPLAATNEVTVFQSLVACLQSLRSSNVALETVNNAFCQGNERQACRLSPRCRVVDDIDGCKIVNNMWSIARSGLFQNDVIIHALENTSSVENLLKHPAGWGVHEEPNFLLQFVTFVGKDRVEEHFTLDILIKTRNERGETSWAVDKAIIEDITNRAGNPTYETDKIQELVRYERNKIAHFGECKDKKLNDLFGRTPDGVITYFNKNVLDNGNLVFSLWKHVREKQISELVHFWNI